MRIIGSSRTPTVVVVAEPKEAGVRRPPLQNPETPRPGEEAFVRAGDFLGLVASNLIAGACVLKEKKGRV
jgi:hypothetical protein